MKKQLLSVAITSAMALPSLATAGTVTTEGEDLVIKTKGGLEIFTKDKSKSFKIGGRIQWDYDDTDSDIDSNDEQDFDIRRARLFAAGHVGDWAFKSQFNLDDDSVEDLYIRYTGFGKQANVTVGKQKEPFGLEEQTSSKDISVLERSAMTEAYVPGRSAGVQLHGKGSNWTYGVGIFEANDDAEDTAFTGRVTYAPIKNDDTVVHVGAAFTARDAEVSSDEFDAFGLEAAFVTGPFHAQAEYFDAEDGDVDVDGYYVQVGYVLTGEMRPYKDGKFKKVKPSGEAGAWEIVARYEDGHGKYSDVGLGTDEGSQLAVGVNYYANSNVRIGLSYMDGETDSSDLNGDELRVRFQFTF